MKLSLLSTTLFILGLSILPISVSANPINATISQIIDGDTVIINQNGTTNTLQLACIDAPDWINGQPENHAQTSKNSLSQLLPIGSTIRYYAVGSVNQNRVLGVIFRNNTNINLQMIAQGQAQLHPNYRNSCRNSANALDNAQSQAQNAHLGIWNN